MATAYVLVKRGDVYELSYYAKNGQIGLTNITAIVYDPSNTKTTIPWNGSDPTLGFCERGDGWYYHRWNSTGKAYGVWHFIMDSASKPSPGPTRIQVVDGATLDDSVFENMMTSISSALSDIQNGVYGLSALKTKIDGVEGAGFISGSDSLKSIKDYLVNTINAAIGRIKNNTSNSLSMPLEIIIPDSGSSTKPIDLDIYNTDGSMEDPDSNQVSIEILDDADTDVSSSYLSGVAPYYMTRVSQGQYHIDIIVQNTDTPKGLRVKISYIENGSPLARTEYIALVSSSTDITGSLTAIDTKLNELRGAGFATLTDSNKAISDAIDVLSSNLDSYLASGGSIELIVSAVQAAITNDVKGSGFVQADDTLHQLSLRTKTIELNTQPGGIAF